MRAEYERTTSVAVRRDRVLREDDLRKQMRPEEFKRTVKVLSDVMHPSRVMEQLLALTPPAATPANASIAGLSSTSRTLDMTVRSADLHGPGSTADGAAPLPLEKRIERLEHAALQHHAGASPAHHGHARRHK